MTNYLFIKNCPIAGPVKMKRACTKQKAPLKESDTVMKMKSMACSILPILNSFLKLFLNTQEATS